MDQLYQKASEATTSNSEKMLPFSKVPGLVAPSGKLDHEIKAFRDSILKKPVPELKDLLARQNAIITNKKLVSKLPDKGAKVQAKIREIEDLIKSKQKSIDEAANMLENLQLGQDPSEKLVDTEAMEWKHGGSLFKHLNLDEKESKNDAISEETANVFSELVAKEVPAKIATHEEVALETAMKFESQRKDFLKTAPFQQLKNEALEDKDKTKILLKHSGNVKIKSREIEVMPLPPVNYAHLKVKEIDLKESMELIQEREKNLKDLRMKNAIEKLGFDSPSTSGQKVQLEQYNGEDKMEYREKEDDSDDDDDEDVIDDNDGNDVIVNDDSEENDDEQEE